MNRTCTKIFFLFFFLPLLLLVGCKAEEDDAFRIVDYSYVLQRNTPEGPEFSFYMYAFSYIKGPIDQLVVESDNAYCPMPRRVSENVFQTDLFFESFEDAVKMRSITALNRNKQSANYSISHNIERSDILGEINVTEIFVEEDQVVIVIDSVRNANYYGFFACPASEDADGSIVYRRAMAGRPIIQPAVHDSDPFSENGRQIVVYDLDIQKYELGVKIIPIAMFETSEGGRVIVESEHTITLNTSDN